MSGAERVLVISPETEHRTKINAAVQKYGLGSISCGSLADAEVFLGQQAFRVVFCHDILPDGDFRGAIAAAKQTPVVVLSRFAEWDRYLAALDAGAFDYMACPPDTAETERIVRAAVGYSGENAQNGNAEVQGKWAVVGAA